MYSFEILIIDSLWLGCDYLLFVYFHPVIDIPSSFLDFIQLFLYLLLL